MSIAILIGCPATPPYSQNHSRARSSPSWSAAAKLGEEWTNTCNYKDTKTKCRLYWFLIEFVDLRHSQSCWYFRPSFLNYFPSNLLTGSPSPSPPPFPKSIQTVCLGGVGVGCWFVLKTIFCRSSTLCFWPDSEQKKLLYHPKKT